MWKTRCIVWKTFLRPNGCGKRQKFFHTPCGRFFLSAPTASPGFPHFFPLRTTVTKIFNPLLSLRREKAGNDAEGGVHSMKFSCEKALLVSAVATTSRAVAAKSSIPAMEGILIEADTRLRLTGYDL